MNETLYRKVGRRYVPVLNSRTYERDTMHVHTWRMVYAYSEGGRRYEYEVKPDNASFKAAAMIAKQAIVDAILKASAATLDVQNGRPFTAKQKRIIKRFRAEMEAAGGMLPVWWVHTSAEDVAKAAIKAVEEWRDE